MIQSEKFVNIRKSVKKVLDRDRYQHTLGVAYTAACLAMKYGEDLDRAYIAGLLHDCAKYIADGERITLCRKWGISYSRAESRSPQLLHAKMGAYLAEHEYEITDQGVLSAIRYHTTGRPDMTLLEKIIYVSDYIEPNRDKAPNLAAYRQEAFTDLDRTVSLIAQDTIEHIKSRHYELDTLTADTYEFYRALTETEKENG